MQQSGRYDALLLNPPNRFAGVTSVQRSPPWQRQTPSPPRQPTQQPPRPRQRRPVSKPYPTLAFKEVNDKYTALKQQVTALTGEKEQQTQAQQTLEQRLATIEGDLTKERHTNQRLQVASAKKLPPELADRLRGETQEELSADADRLLAFLKPAAAPAYRLQAVAARVVSQPLISTR
jgi:hypothetical protein